MISILISAEAPYVIPVEVAQTPWHFTTGLDALDHWQTVIAGVLALAAGILTVVATMIIANKQIAASRAEAHRVIAATRAQTDATFKQTEATVTLAQLRDASEALAFHAMLEAAMARVLAEAGLARKTYPGVLAQTTGASPDAFTVRQSITKGAFAELRAVCVRRGGTLTGDFLDIESEIDSFAMQCKDALAISGAVVRWGLHAGLGEQLALIEGKAAALRQKAFEAFSDKV
jgi:hypothetical protein